MRSPTDRNSLSIEPRNISLSSTTSTVCTVSSIALSALQNSLGFFLAHSYPEVARRAVVMATQLRGVKMSAESIDAVMDPNLWLLTWSGSLVIVTVAVSVAVVRYKPHAEQTATAPVKV